MGTYLLGFRSGPPEVERADRATVSYEYPSSYRTGTLLDKAKPKSIMHADIHAR